MAFTQFAKKQFLHIIDTDEKLLLGRVKYSGVSGELIQMQVHLGCIGTAAGSEQLQIGIHLTDDFSSAYALSNSIFVLDIGAEIANAPNGNFAAAVIFEFNNIPMNMFQFYYITLQASGYTRDAMNHYLFAFKDAPYPINPGGITSNYGSKHIAKFSTIMEVTD